MDPKRFRMARSRASLVQGRTDWYRITNHADGSADIYIYDEIGYWGVTAQDFVKELQAVVATSLTVHINSPGGDVFDGIAIYQALKDHPGNVIVQVDGLAASAASFIAQAGDTVLMTKNATMMIHAASGFCYGNASDMREMVDMLDRVSDNIASIYAGRAGGTVESWRAAMDTETWYSPAEAVAAGLADAVKDDVKPRDDAPTKDQAQPVAASWDLSVFRYQGREQAPAPATPVPAAATCKACREPNTGFVHGPVEVCAIDARPPAAQATPDPAREPASTPVAEATPPAPAAATPEPQAQSISYQFDPDMFRQAVEAAR